MDGEKIRRRERGRDEKEERRRANEKERSEEQMRRGESSVGRLLDKDAILVVEDDADIVSVAIGPTLTVLEGFSCIPDSTTTKESLEMVHYKYGIPKKIKRGSTPTLPLTVTFPFMYPRLAIVFGFYFTPLCAVHSSLSSLLLFN
ncbi:hypothetical protein LWI28_011081 [Acer negundo]|uniref:Uncharacterized protein n=1 Tax=Acer negundo TaxID=4023 RepID=A0AAD5IH01_ACENE|nr:hypothetical protein LWI28_011081 [Acer negundo]